MSLYCQNCGAALADNANFCPQCGASTNSCTPTDSGMSDAAKTAATVGGVIAGAAILNSLGRRLAHRRRPLYGGPPPMPRPHPGPRPGPHHGPDPGFGGPGPGPRRGGGRW